MCRKCAGKCADQCAGKCAKIKFKVNFQGPLKNRALRKLGSHAFLRRPATQFLWAVG